MSSPPPNPQRSGFLLGLASLGTAIYGAGAVIGLVGGILSTVGVVGANASRSCLTSFCGCGLFSPRGNVAETNDWLLPVVMWVLLATSTLAVTGTWFAWTRSAEHRGRWVSLAVAVTLLPPIVIVSLVAIWNLAVGSSCSGEYIC